MPGIQHQGRAVAVIFGCTNAPAALEFFDRAAKRLCDDLVTKADPDQRHALGVNLADQIFERGNPVVVFVNPVARSCDQPSVSVFSAGRKFTVQHCKSNKLKPVACQQVAKQRVVIAGLVHQRLGRAAGLQDA